MIEPLTPPNKRPHCPYSDRRRPCTEPGTRCGMRDRLPPARPGAPLSGCRRTRGRRRRTADDRRCRPPQQGQPAEVRRGGAEHLPYPDGAIDLVVTTTSFDHWSDQQAGLTECARIVRPGGHLVLVDQFSWWLIPTLATRRRGKARTRRLANRLLLRAGFANLRWHNLYAGIIKAVVATKPT
jgi:SAM-dependent methyltransferase